MEPLLEPQTRQLYRILGHAEGDGFSDVRCIIPKDSPLEKEKEFQDRLSDFRIKNKREPDDKELASLHVISRTLIKGEQNVVEWAKKYNGRGNCYIGRTARKSDGTLHEFRTITADIDPDRERGTAATLELSSRAIEGARKVLQHYRGGYLAASGNGALIIYRLPVPITSDFKTFEQRFKAFEEQMRKVLPAGVTLDATFDTARMVKLLGTVSTKGDRANWRHSRFIDFPLMPYNKNDILNKISSCGSLVTPEVKIPSAASLGYKSRSEAVFGLASFCKAKGLSREATLAALRADAFGRGERDDDNQRVIEKIFSQESVKSIIGPEVQELSYSNPGDALDDHKKRLLSRKNFSSPEMSLGLSVIDRHTWGLRRGEIFTIAARPGIGKTSIAASIACRMAREGKRVLYFTSEMSVDSTYDRLLQVLSGLSGDKFTTGKFTDEDGIKLDAAYAELKGFGERLTLCDAASPKIEQVRRTAEKVKPDLLIYDHIQHIGGAADAARSNVSAFVKGLKDIARDGNCAVLALSQIRRLYKDPKTGKEVKPTLSDLKESGTIEEESGAVLLLSILSEESDSPIRCLYSELAKNRYGPITVVGVEFNKFTAHFKDIEDTEGI